MLPIRNAFVLTTTYFAIFCRIAVDIINEYKWDFLFVGVNLAITAFLPFNPTVAIILVIYISSPVVRTLVCLFKNFTATRRRNAFLLIYFVLSSSHQHFVCNTRRLHQQNPPCNYTPKIIDIFKHFVCVCLNYFYNKIHLALFSLY